MPVWNPLTKKWEEESDYTKNFSKKIIQDNTTNPEKEIKVKYSNKPLSNLSTAPLGSIVKNIAKTPENFKDGYQIGDITKTTLGTTADVGLGVVKGIANFGENIGDLINYGLATSIKGVGKLANNQGLQNWAESYKQEAANDEVINNFFKKFDNVTDKYTAAGTTTDQISSGIGNIVAMANGGALLPKGAQSLKVGKFAMPTTAIVSGAGSGMSEAYRNGATDGEALGYGVLSGLTESFSESLFSGLGSKFTKVYGEGGLDDFVIKKITDNISNRAFKILTESGLKATGEGLEEVISGFGSAISKKLTYLKDEEFDKILRDEDLLNQFIMGTLTSLVAQTPSTIQSVKTGQDYIVQNNQDLSSNNANINGVEQNIEPLPKNSEMGEIGINNNTLKNSFQYVPTNNDKINNFNQTVAKYNLDGSQKTINMVNTINKIIQDKGYNVLLDDTIVNKLGNPVNAQIKTVNGEVEIRINPNSPRAVEFLLTHEITHAIETDSMKNLIIDYASKNAGFNEALESLKQSYGVDDVSSEVIADISGQLFGNQEFINNLSMQEPTLFKKIYNKIIEWANKLTGNTNEALFIRDLKNKWETAYKNTTTEQAVNNLGNEIKHNVIYNEDGSFNRVKINANIFENNGGKSINQTIHDYIKEHIGEMYTIIESGQKVYLGEDLPGEYTYSKSAQSLPTTNKLAKGRAASNFKEIVENVNNRKWEKSEKAKHKKDAKYGFYKYDTTFSFDYNGNEKVYTGTVLIRNAENGKKYLYDILNIRPQKKLANLPPVASNSNKSLARFGGSSNQLANNISQSNNVVKSDTLPKYSMQENTNNASSHDNQQKKYMWHSSTKENIDLIKQYGFRYDKKSSYFATDFDASKLYGEDMIMLEQGEFKLKDVTNELNGNDNRELARETAIAEGYDGIKYQTSKNNYDIEITNIDKLNEVVRKTEEENQKLIKQLMGEDTEKVATDNKGRKLTKEVQEHFKDSKAKDENGNLITVYHTTTERSHQFNEFNPVGTDYYKFGDQIVNYFTDDKEMSGSYADQNYTSADTTTVSSMDEVKKIIIEYTQDTQYEGAELERVKNKYRIVDNSLKKAYPTAKKAYDKFTIEEKTNMYNVFKSIQDYIDRGYEGSYDKLDAKTDVKLDEIRGELKTSEEREIFDELRKTNGEYSINDIEDKVLYEFENKDKLLKNIKESLQKITGKQQSNYQYEGYVNITNPYIIDAKGRNWNKIESKKDSVTTEKLIYMDKLTKNKLSQLAKDSKNRYEKAYKEYQKWMDATNSIDGNLRDNNTLEMRNVNRIFREVYADGVKSFINNNYKSQLENGNDDSLNSLYEWRTNNDIMTKMCDWDLISPTEYDEFQKTLQVPDYIREKVKKLADTKVKYNEYDENGRNPILREEKILKIWENYQKASKIYFNNGRYEYSIFDNQLLDGYLNEELKNSFPIRDEFGINDESLKKLYKVASRDFDENYIRSEYNDWSVTNDIVKKIIELNKYGENYDGVIIKNTVDYGGKSENHSPHDLYITFNSNQFKAWNNENPTDDNDIRYSKSNSTWQEHLEKNYKPTGTRTHFKDMMPYATKESMPIEQLKKENKILNPNEISKLKHNDANTTPIAPKVKVETGSGKSKFFDNILDKTDMLSWKSKKTILSDDDVKYYQEVTNKESLEKAFERLNKGGRSETENWLRKDSEISTSVDVAEGWILLKQYQDTIENTTDIGLKDSLNRSMIQVAKKLREIGTKAGQTVQAFNILNRLTPEGMAYYAQSELSEAYEKMVKNKSKEWIDKYKADFELSPSETQFIMETMQEVQNMKDGYEKKVKLAEIQKLMTDKLPPERGAGIKAWMRISMLFNPKTQFRNVLGNAVIAPVNSVGDLVASGVDKLISKKTGVRTTGKTSVKSYTKGFKKGLFESYNDFKLGIDTRNIEGNRFEISQGKSFNNKSAIGKSLNKVDNLLSFMLDAGDRGFYEASFTNSINNQLILNNTTEITQEMIDIATQEALSRTWQDNNNYTRFVLSIRKGLNLIHMPGQKGYGLGDILIPFAKTPANLTKAIIDYSPAGLINTITSGIDLKRSLNNGQYNAQMQHQFVQNLGKATAGTMLYILGYALANAGITSGESDEDKDVANFMKNTLGTSQYSIKIGGKTFTYDWAQPIAAPLAMMSNLTQKQKENTALLENITTTLDTGLNVIFEQSFLSSISNVLSQPGEIGSKLGEQLLELPSRAIPTLSKQIVDLTDGTQRQSFAYGKPLETALNKVKAKVPGLSQALAPSVDTLGREIKKYGGKNNIFNVFFNPANVNTENISESAKEIYRVYKETGDSTVMPRQVAYYINKDGEKIILTNNERAEYQKISGNIIEENIKKIITNSSYKKMSDEDKAEVINNIVNYSYNKARKDVLGLEMSKEYNKVNEWIDNGGKIYEYYVNKEESDYSLENPQKYQSIKNIKVDYYDYRDYQKQVANIKDTYTGSENSEKRKQEIYKYINSLNYNKYQKIILFKLIGGYSIKDYQKEIFNYINGLKLSKNEKQNLWKYLYS